MPATARALSPYLVIIEGVGSGRCSLQDELDAILWVQTDLDIADARDAARIGAHGVADGQDGHPA
jgi:hypothetical protein